MTIPKVDTPLGAARVIIIMIRTGLVVGIIVTAFMLMIDLFMLCASLLGFRPDAALSVGIVALRLLIMVALSLANSFFTRLSQIIGSVSIGDPFTHENADRLDKMGWVVLSAQVLTIPIAMLAGWVEPQFIPRIGVVFSLSLSGLTLPLALFILARVFRLGIKMHEDLEGTV